MVGEQIEDVHEYNSGLAGPEKDAHRIFLRGPAIVAEESDQESAVAGRPRKLQIGSRRAVACRSDLS